MKLELLRQLRGPTIAWFEPMRTCTGNCIDCSPNDNYGFNLDKATRIIDELKKAEVLHLSFAGGVNVEDNSIQKLIKYAADLDFSINYVGCEKTITPEIAKICETIGVDKVIHCLHSGMPTNINEIIKKMVFHNLVYKMQVILTHNTQQLPSILDEKVHDLTRVLKLIVTFSRDRNLGKDDFLDNLQQIEKIMDWSRYVIEFEPSIPACINKTYANLCGAGLVACAVDREGNVYPCQRLRINAGNLLKTPLNEIWTKSPILEKVRQPIEEEPCKSCEYSGISCLGGCKALAYEKKERFDTSDPIVSKS